MSLRVSPTPGRTMNARVCPGTRSSAHPMISSPPFAAPFRFPGWLRYGRALLVPRSRLTANCAALLAALAVPASGQISFTYTTTADSTRFGYNSGQTYTFVFNTARSFNDTWVDSSPSHQPLWTSIGGTGLSGAYQRPANPQAVLSGGEFEGDWYLYAGSNNDAPLGITTPSGSPIWGLFLLTFGGTLPSSLYSPEYIEPFNADTGYFSSYFGTYSVAGGYLSLR
jgi:hypothetical protein